MSFLDDLATRSYYLLSGRECGYPECCIRAFVDDEGRFEEAHPLTGSGFVPCMKCGLLPMQEMIELINSKRSLTRPFPFHDIYTEEECSSLAFRFNLQSLFDEVFLK